MQRRAVVVRSLLLLGAVWPACAGNAGAPTAGPASAPARAKRPQVAAPPRSGRTEPTDRGSTDRATADGASPTVHVAVVEPSELRTLEAKGFALAKLLVGAEARTTAELNDLPAFKSIFEQLRADIRDAARPHPLARVTSIDGFRLFDERWLASNEMSFELSGVFNRLDRRPFYPNSCGEVRFLYRLGYRTEQGGAPMASRLPMTVNVVFLVGDADDPHCRNVAQAWVSDKSGPELTEWLLADGALSAARRTGWTLKSVETNLQTFRLQSSVLPSLGGHIEYDLRVFHATDERRRAFVPAPMENMPDVSRLSKNPAQRAELLGYLREPAVLAQIARGTLTLPEHLLAVRATSFSPRGLSRRSNRPFRTLLSDADFAGVDLSRYPGIGSPAALLRRLDGASCTGCHQSRSIAGFHFVGMDGEATPRFNALLSGMSTHLRADLERRRDYVAALAAGRAVDDFRPPPERQGTGDGFGAPCGLGDPGFADWTCGAGFRCEKLEDPEVGTCLPSAPELGSPCEYGTLADGKRAYRDQVEGLTKYACAEHAICDTNFSGFPLGACDAACSRPSPSGACSDFLDVDGFQNCLRSRGSFAECAQKFVFGVEARACNADNPCRQDYVCVRTRRPDAGACVPPYFVYELRLDGYPLKR